MIVFFLISLLFYRNILISIIASMNYFIIYKKTINDYVEKKKDKILIDFKQLMNIISASCATGDEPSEAYVNSFYQFEKISIFPDFKNRVLESKKYIETYNDFLGGIRMISDYFDIEEIERFCSSITIVQKATGDINSIIIDTIDVLSNRISLKNEIKKIFDENMIELKAMLTMPILIYTFLSFTAFEFLKPIYDNAFGYIVITICLYLILFAYIIGEKTMKDAINSV